MLETTYNAILFGMVKRRRIGYLKNHTSMRFSKNSISEFIYRKYSHLHIF